MALLQTTCPETDTDHEPPIDKMPGHWLFARLGKRVLRPGGLELSRQLLHRLAITQDDDVIEFAPGLGVTAKMVLAGRPRSYTAIERDRQAAAVVQSYITGPNQRCILGTAEDTGLPESSASIVYGEAMLSMQPSATKSQIIAEAARLLMANGRYGIHELCLVPDDLDQSVRDAIERDLSDEVHVGVRPLTAAEWWELLATAGLTIVAEQTAPMHLLEPARLVRDEGLLRAIRFAWNVVRHPVARRRVLAMRNVFRKYHKHLAAIALVAQRTPAN